MLLTAYCLQPKALYMCKDRSTSTAHKCVIKNNNNTEIYFTLHNQYLFYN